MDAICRHYLDGKKLEEQVMFKLPYNLKLVAAIDVMQLWERW